MAAVKLVAALTYDDLALEWDWCWAAKDVEAAAELGRTLLERNRELETTIRQQEAVLDDQSQEMEYLVKQNALLRQAAETRLRLCEQLEIAAVELERSKSRLRAELDAERQRHQIVKHNLEACEERAEELQRLLDLSRASDTQNRASVRTLQQQLRHHQDLLTDEEPSTNNNAAQSKSRQLAARESDEAVYRLVEDLAQLEERLHSLEMELIDEKRKKQQLELEVTALMQENKALQEQSADHHTMNFDPTLLHANSKSKGRAGLSLGEELLLSSDDFASTQWKDAWDNSGPMSLIGCAVGSHDAAANAAGVSTAATVATSTEESEEEESDHVPVYATKNKLINNQQRRHHHHHHDRNQQWQSGGTIIDNASSNNNNCYANVVNGQDGSISPSTSGENEDCYSSSSGFSEERKPATKLTHCSTQVNDGDLFSLPLPLCQLPCAYCCSLQKQRVNAGVIAKIVPCTVSVKQQQQHGQSVKVECNNDDGRKSDYKALFQQIFAVIQQNL